MVLPLKIAFWSKICKIKGYQAKNSFVNFLTKVGMLLVWTTCWRKCETQLGNQEVDDVGVWVQMKTLPLWATWLWANNCTEDASNHTLNSIYTFSCKFPQAYYCHKLLKLVYKNKKGIVFWNTVYNIPIVLEKRFSASVWLLTRRNLLCWMTAH